MCQNFVLNFGCIHGLQIEANDHDFLVCLYGPEFSLKTAYMIFVTNTVVWDRFLTEYFGFCLSVIIPYMLNIHMSHH